MFNGGSAYSGPAYTAYVNQLHFTSSPPPTHTVRPARHAKNDIVAVQLSMTPRILHSPALRGLTFCSSIHNSGILADLKAVDPISPVPSTFINTTYAPNFSPNTNFRTLPLKRFVSKRLLRQISVAIHHHLSILATTPAHHGLHDCTTLLILAALSNHQVCVNCRPTSTQNPHNNNKKCHSRKLDS
jgi:hypothetical protein